MATEKNFKASTASLRPSSGRWEQWTAGRALRCPCGSAADRTGAAAHLPKGNALESQIQIHARPQNIPIGYRLRRAAFRLGLRLFFPRLRMLGLPKMERRGPAILLIAHPRTLPVALLLISALDRRVHCLVPSGQLHGFFRKLAARA